MLILFRLFTSDFSWAKLTSISPLYFIDESILHCISWFIGAWTGNICIVIYNGRTSHFLGFLYNFFSFSLFTELKTKIVTAWSYATIWCYSNWTWTWLKSFAIAETCSCFTCFWFRNLRYLKIRSRAWCCVFNVFVFTLLIRIKLSWRRSFFRKNSTLRLVWHFLFFDNFCICNRTSTLLHGSHCLTCESWVGLIVIKRVNSCSFIRAGSYINIRFDFWSFLSFGLRPRKTSWFYYTCIRIILSRSYFIIFFSFVTLNWRLIDFKFIILILIISIGVYIWRNGRYRLILIDVD